jgi:copper(I)-binding protein
MRTPAAVVSLALFLATPVLAATPVQEAWDKTKPRVSGAWVRMNPVPGRPSAGYLTIEGGGQPDRLLAATAPGVRIEMHSMSMTGGVMRMGKLEGLAVPAGAKVSFDPGGNHLMIFGLAGTPKPLPITLAFSSGAKVTAIAEVRAAGAETDVAPKMTMEEHGHH